MKNTRKTGFPGSDSRKVLALYGTATAKYLWFIIRFGDFNKNNVRPQSNQIKSMQWNDLKHMICILLNCYPSGTNLCVKSSVNSQQITRSPIQTWTATHKPIKILTSAGGDITSKPNGLFFATFALKTSIDPRPRVSSTSPLQGNTILRSTCSCSRHF